MKERNKPVLTSGNVPKQLFYLTMPMIAGMISLVVFNLTDTFFVGRLGEKQLAALSFTFPVVLVINSLSAGIGIGASALISRYLGEGNHYKVERLTTDSLTLGFTFIFTISMIGLLSIRPLFRLLGAEGEVLEFIHQYMFIWFFGVSMIIIPMIGNNIIRALGDTKTPGMIMMLSAAMNIILDPLLIFGLGPFPELGIRGAALTTVLTRGITASVAIYVLHFRRRLLNFRVKRIREVFVSWKEVLHIGIPSSTIRLALPVGSGIVTRLLAAQGPLVVAGFGVATRIEFFALAPIAALSSVMGPFIGQNLGAGQVTRVYEGKKTGQIFSFVIGAVTAISLAIFARPLAGLFNDNPLIVNTTVLYLRIIPFSYGFAGTLQISSTILNVFKKPYHAAGLMALQVFVIYIPLALLGSKLFGHFGVFSSLAVSYIIAGSAASKSVDRQIKKLQE